MSVFKKRISCENFSYFVCLCECESSGDSFAFAHPFVIVSLMLLFELQEEISEFSRSAAQG